VVIIELSLDYAASYRYIQNYPDINLRSSIKSVKTRAGVIVPSLYVDECKYLWGKQQQTSPDRDTDDDLGSCPSCWPCTKYGGSSPQTQYLLVVVYLKRREGPIPDIL
jgi:hypothetical protein